MKIAVKDNYSELSREAARTLARQIIIKPDSVLGLPTGDTPIGMYERLINFYKEGFIDYSQITTFNLDEYYKLPPGHPQSFHRYMEENFFTEINISEENIYLPDGMSDHPENECQRYEREIERHGGIDLIILGIGINGHIGFNEPPTPFGSSTRIVELTEETKSRNFSNSDTIPQKAITMGIQTIMNAQKILLLASGREKAEIIKRTLEGEITTKIPSTILRLHPKFHLIVDKEAGKFIE